MKMPARQAHTLLDDTGTLVEGLRHGGVGVWRWRIDTEQLAWSENLPGVHGLAPDAFDGTLDSFRRDIHPDDLPAVWEAISRSLASGAPYAALYRTVPRDGAAPRWIEARGGVAADAGGRRYLTGVCLDVSERVRNERALEWRLRQQRAIGEVGSFALSEPALQDVLDRAVAAAVEALDLPLAKVLQFADSADHLVLRAGIGWRDGLVGNAEVDIGRGSQAGYTLFVDAPVIVGDLVTETRFDGPPLLHEHGVRSGMSVVIPGTGKRPFGVFGVHATDLRAFDAADVDFLVALANIVANAARQHAAAAQRTLLMREMAHRAGNMLQLVRSVASQTFADGADVAAARVAFGDRLASMAKANYLISQGGWSATRLVALLEESLQPFRGRLALRGRDILLPPDLCFDLGLLVHELATNSVKYGALGQEAGEVEIAWGLSSAADGGRVFALTWSDPNPAPPADALGGGPGGGFGGKLIRALIERKWNGTIRVERENGYQFNCEMPLPS